MSDANTGIAIREKRKKERTRKKREGTSTTRDPLFACLVSRLEAALVIDGPGGRAKGVRAEQVGSNPTRCSAMLGMDGTESTDDHRGQRSTVRAFLVSPMLQTFGKVIYQGDSCMVPNVSVHI